MTTTVTDLAMIRVRQQATWAAGDYAAIATSIEPIGDATAEAADLQAGWRVLDVATGSGNAAIAAARRGARVTGLDYVPALLQRARQRAAVEGLQLELVQGDAENLPFSDGSFDAVLSVFGCMFAPDHRRTAAEIARVCRSGGHIALACWTPEGFAGEMFKAVSAYSPPPPGLQPPVLWGTPSHIAELFSGLARPLRSTVKVFPIRFLSPEVYVDKFRACFGPVIRAFEAAGPARERALYQDLIDVVNRFDRNQNPRGPIAIAAEYLESVLVRT